MLRSIGRRPRRRSPTESGPDAVTREPAGVCAFSPARKRNLLRSADFLGLLRRVPLRHPRRRASHPDPFSVSRVEQARTALPQAAARCPRRAQRRPLRCRGPRSVGERASLRSVGREASLRSVGLSRRQLRPLRAIAPASGAQNLLDRCRAAQSDAIVMVCQSRGGACRTRPRRFPGRRRTPNPHPSGPVAQLAEQQTLNLLVVGSIPTGLTNSHLDSNWLAAVVLSHAATRRLVASGSDSYRAHHFLPNQALGVTIFCLSARRPTDVRLLVERVHDRRALFATLCEPTR